MAFGTNGIPTAFGTGEAIIQPGDTTSLKTVYTAGSNGAHIVSIQVTSDETANARILRFWANSAGSDRLIGAINIPVNSGFSGSVAAVFPLKSTMFGYSTTGLSTGLCVDVNGNPYIQLKASEVLKVQSTTTLATGKTITVRCEALEF